MHNISPLPPYNYEIVDTHINAIHTGCIVEHDNKHMTVGNSDINSGGFMGTTLFGDSYHGGNKPVKKVVLIQN